MTRSPHGDAPPRLLSFAALRRRGWIVPLVVACAAAAAYAVAVTRPSLSTAEGVLIVGSGADRKSPGSANDAISLARTYASAIPEDQRVLRLVARAAGRPVDDVEDDVTAVNDDGTSVLRLRYRDTSEQRAIDGAGALVGAVLESPRRSAIGRGPVREVSVPVDATRETGQVERAVPIGAVLGLALALVLLVGWERSDRRIDGEEQLRSEFAGGVSVVSRVSPSTLGALLGHWRDLAGDPSARIALVPASPRARRGAARIAEVLDDPRVEAAGPLGGRFAGEEAALRSDLAVLVVVPGTPARAVQRAAAALRELGRGPGWAVLTRRRGPKLRESEPAPRAPMPVSEDRPSEPEAAGNPR